MMKSSQEQAVNKRQVNMFRILFHLPSFIKVFGRLMKDRRVPWYAKALPCLAIAYIISPFDLIPGILVPLIGGLDDLIALLLGMKGLVALTPRHIIDEHLSMIDQKHSRA
ncbi:DUF1232 domain-containing protein [bacterium]|nr:DUF1232 domain-containing protein [bacterium]